MEFPILLPALHSVAVAVPPWRVLSCAVGGDPGKPPRSEIKSMFVTISLRPSSALGFRKLKPERLREGNQVTKGLEIKFCALVITSLCAHGYAPSLSHGFSRALL